MVLGLRTLAKGVRGGACAIGGAIKAVAGVAVGGAGNVLNLAKEAVTGGSKAQEEANQAGAPLASQDEAMRRHLLLAALLVVSLTQAPQLLLPGVLGAAAAKSVLAANGNKGKMTESGSEAEDMETGVVVAVAVEGALSGCIGGVHAVDEVGTGDAECEDECLESDSSKARVSVSDKGPIQGDKQLVSLMRSVSDSAVSARQNVTGAGCDTTGVPTAQQGLCDDSQLREVMAEVEQGEKKQGDVRSGEVGDEGSPGMESFVALPEECADHAPHGLCVGCFAFNGTAQDLLEWHQEESGGKGLPEYMVLTIVKHAANTLQAMHLRGMCLESLTPDNILLTDFPMMGRSVTAEHVHLACDGMFEIPEIVSPLKAGAKNVASLGSAAMELLGGFTSAENKRQCSRFSSQTVDMLHSMVLGDRWGLARPTAAELCCLLEQHPVLLVV